MLTKDKIILVYYIATGDLPIEHIEQYINEVMDAIMETVDNEDDSVLRYFIPIQNANSRVECINPKFVAPEEFENAVAALELAQDSLHQAIKEYSKGEFL